MSTPEPASRPRTVVAAFWCWVAAAVLTAALGFVMMNLSTTRMIGVLLAVAGLGLGYLAGRARKGDVRFARAGLGLAMATVVVLALVLLLGPGYFFVLVIAVIMILLITGSVFSRRPTSQQWFESQGAR